MRYLKKAAKKCWGPDSARRRTRHFVLLFFCCCWSKQNIIELCFATISPCTRYYRNHMIKYGMYRRYMWCAWLSFLNYYSLSLKWVINDKSLGTRPFKSYWLTSHKFTMPIVMRGLIWEIVIRTPPPFCIDRPEMRSLMLISYCKYTVH